MTLETLQTEDDSPDRTTEVTLRAPPRENGPGVRRTFSGLPEVSSSLRCLWTFFPGLLPSSSEGGGGGSPSVASNRRGRSWWNTSTGVAPRRWFVFTSSTRHDVWFLPEVKLLRVKYRSVRWCVMGQPLTPHLSVRDPTIRANNKKRTARGTEKEGTREDPFTELCLNLLHRQTSDETNLDPSRSPDLHPPLLSLTHSCRTNCVDDCLRIHRA